MSATAAEYSNPDVLRVLLVEDNQSDAELTLHALRNGSGFSVSADVTQTAEEFTRQVRTNRYDIVLADYNLPQWTGMDALRVLRSEDLDIPLILVTGSLGEERAVECLKQGVTDYVLKDRLTRLPASVRRALEETRLRQEHAESEKELARKVEELARSNADLEQFAYVASHDLQEPLRMVASYTQLLAKRYTGRLDADADQFIAYAVDGANRMQSLIRDLLTYSRVGRAEKAMIETSSETALERALVNLQGAIKDSGAVVSQGPLPMVAADPSQLVQLFQNLVSNAIKYRGAEVPRIRISVADGSKQESVFSVADNGLGIAPQYFEKIFLMFQRLHGREEFPGTGIGLTISKKIVERHGGRIWVESEPGKGSVFHFTMSSKREK